MSHSPFTCRADVAYDMKVRLRQRSLCDGPAVDLVLLDMYLPDGGAAGLPKGLAPNGCTRRSPSCGSPPACGRPGSSPSASAARGSLPVATSSTSSRSASPCVPCGTAAAGVPRWSTGASTSRGTLTGSLLLAEDGLALTSYSREDRDDQRDQGEGQQHSRDRPRHEHARVAPR